MKHLLRATIAMLCLAPFAHAQGCVGDIVADYRVDGGDLGTLLANWGDAPRQDIPPSDCPLALINP